MPLDPKDAVDARTLGPEAADAVEARARLDLPAETCALLARALDEWARGVDDVQGAIGGLPKFDRFAAGHAEGVYVDDKRTPWMEVGGELRFSLARLFSVTPRGVVLVGQIQVTATFSEAPEAEASGEEEEEIAGVRVAKGAKADVRVRYYVHAPEAKGTREVADAEEMTEAVRARHEEAAARAAPADAFDPAFM